MAHKNHVNLQIFKGAYLIDASRLTGEREVMRHIKFVNTQEIDENDIHNYLN